MIAFVRYLLSNLYFFTKYWRFKNNYCFILHQKNSFCLTDIQILQFSPSFPHFPHSIEQVQVG